jgi:hypothetical protein
MRSAGYINNEVELYKVGEGWKCACCVEESRMEVCRVEESRVEVCVLRGREQDGSVQGGRE